MEILEGLGGIDEGECIVRLAHADALWAMGEVEAARAGIAAAYERMTEAAGKIREAAFYEGFLTRVPENAAIVERLREWGRRENEREGER
jgi:hypothetical protein